MASASTKCVFIVSLALIIYTLIYLYSPPHTTSFDSGFRKSLKGFSPIRLLRVYPNELIQTQTYTETAQPNGEPWIKPANTCAVIGNSGILQGSNCGLEIDAHDHVFRSNMAPLEGFQKDVGTRTSLVTINNQEGRHYGWCSQNKNDSCYKTIYRYLNNLNNSTIIWVTKASAWSPKMDIVNVMRTFKPSIVLARPSKSLRQSIARRWKISSPSSGLYVFSLAGNMCSKVSLYGFYPFNQTAEGKPVTYHYYGNASFKNGHHMPEEFKVLKQLNASGVIRLVTSHCNHHPKTF
ncbi:CMP-N-acetylneuraminate-poly-alpha-2,8-sialyltransferase-like [Antedon mediterranea]|uniref:CMP-N-acetylneuraminate-poly-alpha-2, 8-sialyltransferase-like n=1 Tax=Antedon mediterranea TaxID=105859 RepID=UPI003AF84872